VRLEGDGATLVGGDLTSMGLLGLEIDVGTQPGAGAAVGTTTGSGIWRMVGTDSVGADSPEGGRMMAIGAKGAFGGSAMGAMGAFGVLGGSTMGAVTGSRATGGRGGASPLAI
jgi:hypothetical protein